MQDESGREDGQMEVGIQGKDDLLLRAWLQEKVRLRPGEVFEMSWSAQTIFIFLIDSR
jgi:hypothetical protein